MAFARPESPFGVASASSRRPVTEELREEGAVDDVERVVASVAVDDDAEDIVEAASEFLFLDFDVESS